MKVAKPSGALRTGIALLVLLIASSLIGLSFTLVRLRAQALDGGMRAAETHARNFEEHLTQILQVSDLMMLNLEAPGQGNATGLGAAARLAIRPAPYLRSLSLLDAQGTILVSSSPGAEGKTYLQGDVFPAGDPQAEVLRIGAPRAGRDVGATAGKSAPLAAADVNFIPVLRRMPGTPGSDRNGTWALAALNPDFFINHFTQLVPLEEGHVQLLRYDGKLLASSLPQDVPGVQGQDGLVNRDMQEREAGRLEQTLADGRVVLTAYRASSRYPLVTVVHIDRDHLLAAWQAEARLMLVIVLPALAALAALGAWALHRQSLLAEQQAELYRQTRLSASVFEASSEAILLTTARGEIISCNPAFLQMTGYALQEVLGKTHRLVTSGEQDDDFFRAMWEVILRDDRWQGELHNRRKDGTPYQALVSINAVRDAAGVLLHYVIVGCDITERKRAEAAEREAERQLQQQSLERLRLMEQAVRDALTGLYNRRYLDETLPREISRVKRVGQPLSVVIMDIDHFKRVNDTHGHLAGDEVLRAVAQLLSCNTREGDVVCRYGGEEFVVVMPQMDLAGAAARANKWRQAVADQAVRYGQTDIRLSLSAGVATFPQHGQNADELLHCADLALYESKNQGRNRVSCGVAQDWERAKA